MYESRFEEFGEGVFSSFLLNDTSIVSRDDNLCLENRRALDALPSVTLVAVSAAAEVSSLRVDASR